MCRLTLVQHPLVLPQPEDLETGQATCPLPNAGYLRFDFDMDPISAAASVLGVLGAIQKASEARRVIVTLVRAPGELSTLFQELECTEELLKHVRDVCGNAQTSTVQLEAQIQRCNDKLLELQWLVQYSLVRTDDSSKVARVAWARKRTKVEKLRHELREIRHDLDTALSSANLRRNSDTSIEVQQLAISGVQSSERQLETLSMLTTQKQQLDGCFRRIEESQQTQAKLAEVLGSFRRLSTESTVSAAPTLPPYEEDESAPEANGDKASTSQSDAGYSRNVDVVANEKVDTVTALTEPYSAECAPSCRCASHKTQRIATPWSMKN